MNQNQWSRGKGHERLTQFSKHSPLKVGVSGGATAMNLLGNGSFEQTGSNWLSPWSFDVKTGAAATISQDSKPSIDGNYSAKVTITKSSTFWYVQLTQPIALTSGQAYTLTFSAKASTNRSINISLQQDYSPWTVYTTQDFKLTNSWQQYRMMYTPGTSDANAMVVFNLAQATGQVWLDNIVLTTNGTAPISTPMPTPTVSASPTPTAAPFVTRSGRNLLLNGRVWRFAGTNIHWLGLDDPNGGTYPTTSRIDNVFAAAHAMHATVVRSHTLGASVGCANCIEPNLNQFNNQAFKTIDYAISTARKYDIRLIIPLVDNWHYYHGGKHTFTDWRGLINEDDFYSNATVIQDFKNYIAHILNHVNPYTGIALKDDPTILAWETGNELGNNIKAWDNSWTETIAKYIKSLAPHHLVLDGHTADDNGHFTVQQLQNPSVDMYTDHFYPLHIAKMQAGANLTKHYNKVYVVGEYDCTDKDAVSAQATISQDSTTKNSGNYSANIDITQNHLTAWHVQLTQGDFTLHAGQTYTVSFWAKASVAGEIGVTLQQNISPWIAYFDQYLNLETSWKQYTFSYTPNITQTHAMLVFNLAEIPGHVWIDTVSVKSQTSGNLLENNSFEKTGRNWLEPWTFQVKPERGDLLSNFLPAIEADPAISGDLYWQLYDTGYSGDWYTLHYPADNSDMQNRVQLLTTHASRMKSGN